MGEIWEAVLENLEAGAPDDTPPPESKHTSPPPELPPKNPVPPTMEKLETMPPKTSAEAPKVVSGDLEKSADSRSGDNLAAS